MEQRLTLELGRGLDRDHLDALGTNARVRHDGQHARTSPCSLVGERGAHPAGAAIAEEAHRIERLARAAGGHEDLAAVERARAQQPSDRSCDRGRLAHPTHAGLALGERAVLGADEHEPALVQGRHVRAGRRVVPHPHVHRGRDDDRTRRREHALRHDVVGEAVRELGQRVRGARCDAHERRNPGGVEVRIACHRARARRAAPDGG